MPFPVAMAVAFGGGFAVMVLEIVGIRLLARDFGSSFYVWTSQIGVVLIALTLGYVTGGFLADRGRGTRFLAGLLVPAGLFTMAIPMLAAPVIGAIVERHPADREIPLVWQKLDPALGAALVFFPPCFVLATLPPCLIRSASSAVTHVGRVSGTVYGAGSLGSIAGVFASGYWLIDGFTLTRIFQGTGLFMLLLALACGSWKRHPHSG